MASVAVLSALTWLPVAYFNAQQHQALAAAKQAGSSGRAPGGRPPASTAELLGARRAGAPAAVALPLVALSLLYLGPLLHLATSAEARASHPTLAAISQVIWGSNGGSGSSGALRLQLLRDLVVAPASEEWAFRACMVPLLWMAGVSRRAIILVTPLFFGSAHLHHLRELVAVQGMSPGGAAAVVMFQFAYTTVFGWLATWVFVSTGHALAPALVHAACNALGIPRFGLMARPRVAGVPVLWAATLLGILLFWRLAPALLEPRLFSNTTYSV